MITVGVVALVGCRDRYDVHNYAANVAEAWCARVYDCCSAAEIEAAAQARSAGGTSCEAAVAGALAAKQAEVEASIRRGRLTYEPES